MNIKCNFYNFYLVESNFERRFQKAIKLFSKIVKLHKYFHENRENHVFLTSDQQIPVSKTQSILQVVAQKKIPLADYKIVFLTKSTPLLAPTITVTFQNSI